MEKEGILSMNLIVKREQKMQGLELLATKLC